MANGCSIYETRLRTFYRKMEARYGSSSRCYVTPSRSCRRWRNTASNISAAGQGDVVPDAGRRLLGSSTRLHQSRRRGINNRSGHSGGSSCEVGRSLSTRTAERFSRDLEKAQYTQSSNATAAAAADTVRRNAGNASHRGLEEGGGWLGWARACGSSRKSRARSTSRSSSPSNSSDVPRRALNSLSSRSPRTQQGRMLSSNRTAEDKEVSEEKVCKVSAAGRTAFCTTALWYQHCHPKDEDHLERQDLEVKQTEQRKRQQTLQKTTKRAQLLQQETVSSSMQKDAASKRRRPATIGNANKRARFTGALPAAADDATLSEKNSWAAASTDSVFGRRQEHQQNTERLQRRGSCDSQNSGWARCKAVGEILAAVEPIELKAEAVTTKAGYNSAGAAAVAPATYSATVAQSIPAALFAISLRKSTSSRRHRTRSPVATPPFTTAPSLAAPLEPAGAPGGKWSDQERPPLVELAAVTDNREAVFLAGKLLYCSSTPEVLGVEAPPSQEGSQQHERSASTGAASAARVRSSADVVGDVPKCNWLLKATRQFDTAARADNARQQLEPPWHSAKQVHAKQSWQQFEVQQRHQCNEQRTQHIPEPGVPLDPQQWQQQNVRRLHQEKLPRPQQTLHSLQQPCQKQELCHMQQADHSRQRKSRAPQQLPERSVQTVRVQRLQKFCHQAVHHSQQGEALQRDAHHRRRQSALLLRHSSGQTGRDCLLQGAAAGTTSRGKSRARIHTTRSSKPLSNDSGGSLDYPNPSNNSNSDAAAAVTSGDENEEWCKTTSGCNSSNNRRKRSSPTALISSRCNSDAKSTCASAVATAAAFNALPRARGVWFDAIRSLVRTSWKEGGRVRTAGFPVRTLGLAEARMRAVEYRFFRCPNDPLPSDLRAIVPRKKPEEYGWTT